MHAFVSVSQQAHNFYTIFLIWLLKQEILNKLRYFLDLALILSFVQNGSIFSVLIIKNSGYL